MSEPTPSDAAHPTRPVDGRRLAAVIVGAIATVAAAFALAAHLDRPVGEAPRDASPINPGPVQIDATERLATKAEIGRHFGLIIERPYPPAFARLEQAERLSRLRRLAASSGTQMLVQLGAAEQEAGDQAAGAAAYRAALAREPNDVPARIGLAFTEAAGGGEPIGRAALLLQRLFEERPNDQTVAFNRGWLAIYRQDPTTALFSLQRAIDIDAGTGLGQAAARFADGLRRRPSGTP